MKRLIGLFIIVAFVGSALAGNTGNVNQTGVINEGTIDQVGDMNWAQINQLNATFASKNIAAIYQAGYDNGALIEQENYDPSWGLNDALINQQGESNYAEIRQYGRMDMKARIYQVGIGNTAYQSQYDGISYDPWCVGWDNAFIEQIGNRNYAEQIQEDAWNRANIWQMNYGNFAHQFQGWNDLANIDQRRANNSMAFQHQDYGIRWCDFDQPCNKANITQAGEDHYADQTQYYDLYFLTFPIWQNLATVEQCGGWNTAFQYQEGMGNFALTQQFDFGDMSNITQFGIGGHAVVHQH
jgi:hypothetical protein